MKPEKQTHRPFACDRCGCMHHVQTNHEGQIYSQKCKNWPCTAGTGDYTSMTYWGGNASLAQASHVDSNLNQVFLLFKSGINKHGAPPTTQELLKKVSEGIKQARELRAYRGDRMPINKHGVQETFRAIERASDAMAELMKRLENLD